MKPKKLRIREKNFKITGCSKEPNGLWRFKTNKKTYKINKKKLNK